MKEVLLVGTGGFLGAVLRYLGGVWLNRWEPVAGLPHATLVVNIVGCFLIGFMAGVLQARPDATSGLRYFVVIGILGGFTTFSAFGLEALELAKTSDALRFGLYIGAHIFVGIAAVWIGGHLARWV